MWLVHNFVRTLLTIQCMHFGQLSQLSFAQTIDSKLSLNGIKALKLLCPEVDICIRDASGPMVRPNRILDNGIFVSICHGCSCHEDCHDMLTCCFPGDMDTGNDAAASTTLESHSVDSNTTSPNILDNSLDHNLATSKNHLNTSYLETDQSVNSDNTSAVVGHIAGGDAPVSTSQCLFARTGDAEGSWNENIPAYRMVSKAPSDGCIPDVQMKQDVREGAGPVAPWGDLYPVYSSKHGTIYKNALYARCHGTYDYVHMTATLACDHVDEQTGRVISVADHFTFLQQKSISPYCFITFDYKESAMLTDNRCFVDTVASCPITYSNDSFRIPDGVNITHTEVRNACYSGLHAPILLDVVYRNIFCAVCNNLVPDVNYLQKISFTDPSDKHFQRKTTYLLDVSFLLENEDTIDSLETVGYPEVCLPADKEQGTESCRRLSCPSGQVRDKAGVCRYPFKTWYRGVFSVTVKLVYINKNISVNDILDAGLQRADDIYHGFLSSSPWPSRWEILTIFHPSEDAYTGSSIALELVAATTKPSHVLQTIRIAMARPWIWSLNGTNIPFRQSLFEFSFTRESFRFFPAWQPYIDLLGPALKDNGAPFLTWRVIHSTFSMYAYPYQVTKLFTCESVSLLDGEYTLMANNLVLINKLTGSVMFDKEFGLLEHENGQLIPHVCLSDTTLLLKSQSTNKQAVSWLTIPILMLVRTIVTF